MGALVAQPATNRNSLLRNLQLFLDSHFFLNDKAEGVARGLWNQKGSRQAIPVLDIWNNVSVVLNDSGL